MDAPALGFCMNESQVTTFYNNAAYIRFGLDKRKQTFLPDLGSVLYIQRGIDQNM